MAGAHGTSETTPASSGTDREANAGRFHSHSGTSNSQNAADAMYIQD